MATYTLIGIKFDNKHRVLLQNTESAGNVLARIKVLAMPGLPLSPNTQDADSPFFKMFISIDSDGFVRRYNAQGLPL